VCDDFINRSAIEMQDSTSFATRAAAEIDGLHRLLQAWFRAEGDADPAPVLAHFDEDFVMVTPAGKFLSYQQFAAAFPGFRGTRPTLVMQISEVAVRHVDNRSALVTYHERQIQDSGTTDRISTALLLARADRATPVWRHLQETMQG
jgi:uncharacterized protein (TIGR02246 family)